MSCLYNALENFHGAGKGNFMEKLATLDIEFKKIARILLCDGYLQFGDDSQCIKIFIRDVEFYYYEEDGICEDEDIMRDPIMYHVNEKAPSYIKDKSKFEKRNYYKTGTFNFHVSGVDITFEKENFRASALIRGFSVHDPNSTDVECRPTYLYEFFNNSITPFGESKRIEWKDEDIKADGGIIKTFRKNVPLYRIKKDNAKIILRPDFLKKGKKHYEAIPFNEKRLDSTFDIAVPWNVLADINICQTITSKKLQDTIHLWRFCRNVNLKDNEWKDEKGKEIGVFLT